jgi:hypothetical protein
VSKACVQGMCGVERACEGRVQVGFEGQVLTGRGRYWRASRVLACLSGVVNPLLEFEFEEKDKKVKKTGKIKGLKQKKQESARTPCYNFDVMLQSISSPRREAASPPPA